MQRSWEESIPGRKKRKFKGPGREELIAFKEPRDQCGRNIVIVVITGMR